MTTEPTPIRVKHFCNIGDAIASLAGLKAYYESTGKKIIFCQQKNVEANYYSGATHGTTADNDASKMVCMNTKMWNMLQPLLLSQEYIDSCEEYVGQQDILIDIDVIRKKVFVNLPHGQIQAWIMYAYPDLAYDLSRPWIDIDDNCPEHIHEQVDGKIIVNLTERYRNGHISYYFLRKYKHRLLFAGTEREHLLFVNKWGIDMPLLKVNDFLDIAYALKNCKFLIANQSAVWNLAEAMKCVPRVLEICEFAVNCMPFVGPKSYGFYHQQGLEYYVDILTC